MERPDFSDYVVHFTKDAKPFGAKKNPDDSAIKNISGNANDRLTNILSKRLIYATPMPWTNCKAVAFTECPWSALLDHSRHYSSYGVGFHKKLLYKAKGGPAIYLKPDLYNQQLNQFVHKNDPNKKGFYFQIHAFITPFAPQYAPQKYLEDNSFENSIDYTHEREWRVPADFHFSYKDIKFIIVENYEDVARFPKKLKDDIGRDKFIIMDVYRNIEKIWPTHKI